MTPPTRRAILLVLDGFGEREATHGNAIRLAKAPTLHRLLASPSRTNLATSGEAVGLPAGQMGNSEVGHMTIGGGRVFHQMLTRIDLAVADGSFFANAVLRDAFAQAKAAAGRVHLLGLVSDGGVHSHLRHFEALLDLARREGFDGPQVVVHAFTDGRDTPPQSGVHHLGTLEAAMKRLGVGIVGTVGGRYHAMDRDKRWDRTKKAWDAIVHGIGPVADEARGLLEMGYAKGVTDEFVEPTVIAGVAGHVRDGDSVIFVNFRPDRARQLTRAFTQEGFAEFPTGKRPRVRYATMTEYDATFTVPHAFAEEDATNPIGEVVAAAGLRQLRIAETEKYAHVTYFLNGGRETEFPGEERILVPSPQVPTYDHAPEMSARGITDRVVEAIEGERHHFIALNFANCDMVGHTGDLSATIRAVETVDACLARILEAARAHGYEAIVTADHGNAEEMIAADGGLQTAHTTLPVPAVYVGSRGAAKLRDGTLADVAPTLLDLLALPKPKEMTGRSLFGHG